MNAKELKDSVKDALKVLEKDSEVKQAEAYASYNYLKTMRLSLTTNIPTNGLEEPKSFEDYGLSVRLFLKNGKKGFGKISSDLSRNAAKEALKKAKKNSVYDKYFTGFPEPKEKPKIKDYHDKKMEKLSEEKAEEMAYSMLDGAMKRLKETGKEYKVNFTGEIDFLLEKIAIANTNGILETDESTISWNHLTSVIEEEQDVAGMEMDSGAELKKIDCEKTGYSSMDKGILSLNAEKVETGNYKVVLGRHALTDLFTHIFDPSLSSIDSNSSPFVGKKGKKIFSEKISIQDNALAKGEIGTKRITDEGLATTKTKIVEKGVLESFLSDYYYAQKIKDKEYNARNGFRFSGGGRYYGTTPGISATNLEIANGDMKQEELFEEIGNGLYIDRIWYTYPVNGSTVSDFTSTVRGNSFIVKNGKKQKPLLPNTCRLNDNLERVFQKVLGVGKEKKPTLVWGAEAVVIAPEIAVEDLRVDRIAVGLY